MKKVQTYLSVDSSYFKFILLTTIFLNLLLLLAFQSLNKNEYSSIRILANGRSDQVGAVQFSKKIALTFAGSQSFSLKPTEFGVFEYDLSAGDTLKLRGSKGAVFFYRIQRINEQCYLLKRAGSEVELNTTAFLCNN
ncbi:hypothetical protein [Vibrio cholerae]|uniref:hypothetical protein n=1 Tax=Vibrio cholerae TaxID=666 RepID=UPI0030808C2D